MSLDHMFLSVCTRVCTGTAAASCVTAVLIDGVSADGADGVLMISATEVLVVAVIGGFSGAL